MTEKKKKKVHIIKKKKQYFLKNKIDSTEIEYVLTYFSTLLIFLVFANL